MPLLSDLIVQGVRRGSGSVLGQAVGGGLAGAASGGFGVGGGGYAPQGSVRETDAERAARLAGSSGAPPPGTTDVAPVDVMGTGAAGVNPGSAVGQALAASAGNALFGAGTGTPPALLNTPPSSTPNMDGVTDGDPLATATAPQDGLSANDLLIPAGLLGAAGLMAPSGAGVSAATGGLPFGITPADLVAAGVLGTGLVAGSGGTGAAGDGLKQIAEDSGNLAKRLGNIADAGFQGNIGGKGLNSIARMVRKAQAAIRQRYASMGMTGSTAETDDLNDAVEAGVQQQFEIGQKMAATGLNAIAALTGQSAQAYLALLNAQTAKNTALGNALANFAGAIAH